MLLLWSHTSHFVIRCPHVYICHHASIELHTHTHKLHRHTLHRHMLHTHMLDTSNHTVPSSSHREVGLKARDRRIFKLNYLMDPVSTTAPPSRQVEVPCPRPFSGTENHHWDNILTDLMRSDHTTEGDREIENKTKHCITSPQHKINSQLLLSCLSFALCCLSRPTTSMRPLLMV